MAKKSKAGGLGRGLGALFSDYNVSEMEESSNNIPNEARENVAEKTSKNIVGGADEVSDKSREAGVQKSASAFAENSEDFETAVVLIDINSIKPNEGQPRKNFDAKKISELAESIREHGIIQPLVLRKSGNGYELVAGERRWRAAREAGLKKAPAIVRELSDSENMLIAIIENMQREDLNPVEEAEGINQMIRTYGLTQEQVSKSLGKSRPYITNALRILALPKEALESLAKGEISAGHGRALLSIQNQDRQIQLLQRIIREGLSVRDIEKISQNEKSGSDRKRGRRAEKSRDVLAVEQDLKEIFGTKVNITTNGKKGAIEIEYYSEDELNRLIDLIKTIK